MSQRASRSNATTPSNVEQPLEQLSLLPLDKKPYREFTEIVTAQVTHYYISESIGEPSEYVDIIHRLNTAAEGDVVYFHLNTPGGMLDTGVQMISAMKTTEAHVVTILEGSAFSLGTLIFLAGHEMIVHDHALMMFHNFSSGLCGKGNEMALELQATIEWFASLAQEYYVPFLTEDEVETIKRGQDKWMHAPEIRTRLDNMIAIQAAELEAQEAEAISEAVAEKAAKSKASKPTVA